MITLHHLNKSRSKRIIWLLEEIGVEYQVKPYLRDPNSSLAPEELKAIHPLGKSPIIEEDGVVIAESGAIVEYLIDKYAPYLQPERGSTSYIEYLQWIHFAESSMMVPLLLKMFLQRDGSKTNFLESYAQTEIGKVCMHLNQSLEGKRYLVDNKLTGADIMMSFPIDAMSKTEAFSFFGNFKPYLESLRTHEGCQKAEQIELELNT